MNVQTEKLDNHLARLTVEVELEQLEQAKKKAARRLAGRVNIPGFRKGKAPYHVLVNYVGEAYILEDAIETLGNDVYRNALETADVKPYAAGELENFTVEPKPTFIFTVPMEPTVELNDYLSVRVDYDAPSVEDKDVEDALRRLQEENAVVEETEEAAVLSNRVTADLHGFFDDDDDDDDDDHDYDDDDDDHHHDDDDDDHDDDDDDDDDDHDDDDDDDQHFHNAPIHEHDAQIYLEAGREPVEGFADALVGVKAGERREFFITYPEDAKKYDELAGRRVRFVVDVKKVEAVTLPAIDDELASKVTAEEESPLNLEQLRERLRENITTSVNDRYKNTYVEKVFDKLVEVATFGYPEAMIVNQIDRMAESTAQQYGLTVEDYFRILQKSPEDMHTDPNYRESAVRYVKRSLVMRGILDTEDIKVSDADINAEVERFLAQFGEQSEMYRGLFDTPEMRENMANNLLEQKVLDRIVGIGRGEAVEVSQAPAPQAEEAAAPEANADEGETNVAE